jgi:hypothetical protein
MVASPCVLTKIKRFVEARRRRIVGAQADVVKSAVGGLEDTCHQLPAYPVSARCEQDVQMPEPTDALIAGIRVDIEPADPHQPAIEPGAEQGLSWPVKAIRPGGPLFDQSADEAQSERLTLGDQVADRARCRVMQVFDHREHVLPTSAERRIVLWAGARSKPDHLHHVRSQLWRKSIQDIIRVEE